MKKRVTAVAVMIGLLMSTAIGFQAEASWLSKTLEKLDRALGIPTQSTSSSSSSTTSETSTSGIRLPRESDYPRRSTSGDVIGKSLSKQDMTVLGVTRGTSFEAIERSLGEPTRKELRYMNPAEKRYPTGSIFYGGIEFQDSLRNDADRLEADYIEITNRDAVTARGIAVGDSLEKVFTIYGRPTYVRDEAQIWFYGAYIPYSDYLSGIQFWHDNEKVTKIRYL